MRVVRYVKGGSTSKWKMRKRLGFAANSMVLSFVFQASQRWSSLEGLRAGNARRELASIASVSSALRPKWSLMQSSVVKLTSQAKTSFTN